MEINRISSINNNFNVLHSGNGVKTNQNQRNDLQLMSNSINEMAGRSQVSFTGENIKRGSSYIHECKNFSQREKIVYDAKTGEFHQWVYYKNGKLKDEVHCIPAENKEYKKQVEKDGYTTIVISRGDSEVKQELDCDNREVYRYDLNKKNGIFTEVTTDYDRKRRIVNTNEGTAVVDMNTNKAVTSGPLLYDETYDENTDSYVTKNIVTGDIVKVAQYRRGRIPVREIEYYEGTHNLKRDKSYNPLTGDTTEKIYRDVKGSLKQKIEKTSKGHVANKFFYAEDGKTVTTHVVDMLDDSYKVYQRTFMNPHTNAIIQEIKFSGDKKIVSDYYKDINVVNTVTVYKNEKCVRESTYDKNGEKIREINLAKDGSEIVDFYSDGKKYKQEKYDSNGTFYYACNFDSLGNISYEKSIDRNGKIEERSYRKDGTLKNHKVTTSYSAEETAYWQDGTTPKYQRYYDKNGSYSQTDFDEYGRCCNFRRFDKYGREIIDNPSSASWKTQKFDEMAFLEKLSGVRNSDISDKDLEVFAQIIEFGEDISKLRRMDKGTYRQLAKQSHPDLHPNDKKAEAIFKIVNNLFSND